VSLLVEDRELLLRFRAGESAAVRAVFEHYAPAVTSLLRRGFSFRSSRGMVRFSGFREIFDLEDALQEIFRRAFSDNARSAYDGLRSYRTYLSTIARNVVINMYQVSARRLERLGFEEVHEPAQENEWTAADDVLGASEPAPTGRPAEDAETAELRRLVSAYRQELSAREAEVFALRFDDGLSHTEITARTGLSPSKIKTAEARIRKGLLHMLRRHGYLARAWERAARAPSASRSAAPGLQGEKS